MLKKIKPSTVDHCFLMFFGFCSKALWWWDILTPCQLLQPDLAATIFSHWQKIMSTSNFGNLQRAFKLASISDELHVSRMARNAWSHHLLNLCKYRLLKASAYEMIWSHSGIQSRNDLTGKTCAHAAPGWLLAQQGAAAGRQFWVADLFLFVSVIPSLNEPVFFSLNLYMIINQYKLHTYAPYCKEIIYQKQM